jgi:hypothetical protein
LSPLKQLQRLVVTGSCWHTFPGTNPRTQIFKYLSSTTGLKFSCWSSWRYIQNLCGVDVYGRRFYTSPCENVSLWSSAKVLLEKA